MTTMTQSKADGSGFMFDKIAKKYDLLNRIISMGLDQSWRQKLINSMPNEGELLDLATGTADVAISLAKQKNNVTIKGLDPSVGMLEVGKEKVKKLNLENRIDLIEGSALDMPFEDQKFSGCCVAFGIRNFPDRLQGLKEMARVTKSGGVISILELSEPRDGFLSPFVKFHVHHVVPWLGAILSGQAEYRYLQKSVAAFPPPQEFAGLMEQAGLKDIQILRMPFGVAHLYISKK
jgi:demethylmenaquinone methyltransferase/2-methoxy-6-polyprenyl-1,4-benzoquinol methylase